MGPSHAFSHAAKRVALPVLMLVALAQGAAVPTAHAQEHDYTETIREALAEFEVGHFEESLALFRLAHSLRPSARTLRGLGNASFELRHYVDAVRYYRESLASAENPLTPEQRDEVDHLLARARVFVGGYRLAVTPPGAVVTIDSASLEATEVLLAIGDHTVTVTAPGFTARTLPVTVRGGEDETLTITLEAAGGPAVATGPVLGPAVGPAVAPQGVIAPPAPAEVHLHVEARSPGLVLHAALEGPGATGMAPVCAAPCDATVRGGTYWLGVGVGAGEPAPVLDGRVRIDHDATYGIVFESREGLRIAGGVTFGVGLAAGLALVFTAVALGGDGYGNDTVIPIVLTGALLIPVSGIVGLILGFHDDVVSAREIVPGVRF